MPARMLRLNVTLDAETIARFDRIRREKPELSSLSAAIRYAARVTETSLLSSTKAPHETIAR